MKILSESKNFILAHEYEDVTLENKNTGKRTNLGDHYGDPEIGIIAPDESWFITAGEGLLYFDFDRGLREFLRTGFPDHLGKDSCAFIHSVRFEPPSSVRIIVDPWSEHAATYELDVAQLEINKICDGPSMVDKPWQKEVDF